MAKTRTFRLNKLVLDGIFHNMIELGQKPDYSQLEGAELLRALARKITEETDELLEDPDIKELVGVRQATNDFLKALEEYADKQQLAETDLKKALSLRFKNMGEFGGGYYVRTLTLSADDEWCKYYESRPERFPEVNK